MPKRVQTFASLCIKWMGLGIKNDQDTVSNYQERDKKWRKRKSMCFLLCDELQTQI